MMKMPKIELLNIDCMEYMATLPDKAFELAIVDPPYGIGAASKDFIRFGKQTGKSLAISGLNYKPSEWDNVCPDENYFYQLIRVSNNQIIWGINYLPYYFGSGAIVWDKDNSDNKYSDCELAYQSLTNGVRKVKIRWHGMLQQDMKNKEQRIHPTQKPVALYKWLLHNYAKPGDRILDTHLGSGSSAIAAHQMGFEFVGCELDKDYYDASIKRFKEQTMQQSLFNP